jgi:hypothetical protein
LQLRPLMAVHRHPDWHVRVPTHHPDPNVGEDDDDPLLVHRLQLVFSSVSDVNT